MRISLQVLPTAFAKTFIPIYQDRRRACVSVAASRRPESQPRPCDPRARPVSAHRTKNLARDIRYALGLLWDMLIMFTRIASCAWAQHLMSSGRPACATLLARLYQFLRSPSLVKLVIHWAHSSPLVSLLASCEQLKSLTVGMHSSQFEEQRYFPALHRYP